MLRSQRQGDGWSVLQDAVLVRDEKSSGVYKTEDSAVRQVMRTAADTWEEVELRQWHRRHMNGWLADGLAT
jgi:hypothetical protein